MDTAACIHWMIAVGPAVDILQIIDVDPSVDIHLMLAVGPTVDIL